VYENEIVIEPQLVKCLKEPKIEQSLRCVIMIKVVIKRTSKVLVSYFSRYLLEFEPSTLHKTCFI
jgi:hypothetical protein